VKIQTLHHLDLHPTLEMEYPMVVGLKIILEQERDQLPILETVYLMEADSRLTHTPFIEDLELVEEI
jgi:hypothetical protein